MTDKNTPQPVLTDDEIRSKAQAIWGMRDFGALEFARAIESAVLSKLRAPVADERAALADLLEYVDRNTCTHEDTHRGGAIWTICDGCGMKWADDEGGFVPHQDAPAVAAARASLASAPVAGEAQIIGYVPSLYLEMRRRGMPVNSKIQHSPGDDATAPLYAASQARPSDDELWDQTLTERDEYHDIADKLANAIADHLLVEIGEHSSGNCPWMRALEAIENAAPQASEAEQAIIAAFLERSGQWLTNDATVKAARDAAFEAVRKQLCKLPRYSFFAGAALGSVRRVEDRLGNWIEFDAVHELFDPVAVDAALSAQPADKPAISSPSSAGNPCPAPVPAYPQTGKSHTDGGAVYG